MAFNFIVAPGTILKEYMDSRSITQKDLARITGSSERHISNLINAKVRLTEDFALKLEDAFGDVVAEFWMDLESTYKLKILRKQNESPNLLKVIAKDYQFEHVFKGLKYSIQRQAEEMLKLLGATSFDDIEREFSTLSYNFMEDGGNQKALYVWLKLCEEELHIQNDLEIMPDYSKDSLNKKLDTFKGLMYTQDFKLAISNLRRISNMLGIGLVILDAIPTSKVRGATTFIDDHPVIFLSTRFKRLDTFYFAFMHEIAHIINEDYIKIKYNVALINEGSELGSSEFARNFFIDKINYDEFVSKHYAENELTEEDIIVFSKKQKVIADIVLGYLEHDKVITDYSKFYYLKGKIKK